MSIYVAIILSLLLSANAVFAEDGYSVDDIQLQPGAKARAEDPDDPFDEMASGLSKLPDPHPTVQSFSDPVAPGFPAKLIDAATVRELMGGRTC